MWRGLFEILGRYFGDLEFWTFMNYGFFDCAGEPKGASSTGDCDNRYATALYHRVATSVDLMGKDMLEVGAGRGGGAAYIAREFRPRRVVGVDIAQSSIEFCRRVHRINGLEFYTADAERLPFPNEAFDAVLNIESSFCYPSMERFLTEVRRVLRPGGYFLFADLRLACEIDELLQVIGDSGMMVIGRSDVSANVAAALRLDSAQRARLSRQKCPRPFKKLFDTFVGVQGTRIPNALADGRMYYLIFVLQKLP
jgi:SAM-dependent methyltransferase